LVFCRYPAWHCCAHWQPIESESGWTSVETAGWNVIECHWSQWNWQRLRTRFLWVDLHLY